jgi:long-chain acyl-CoA synthetase
MATQLSMQNHYTALPLPRVELDTIPRIFFRPIDHAPRPDAMLFRRDGEWRPTSHAEVLRQVEQLAAALAAMGVQRGDRVAILSENRPEWAVSDFAALGIGAVDVPIYATLPAAQVAYILNDCQAKVILVSTREQLAKVLEIRGEVPALQEVVCFEAPDGAEGVLHLATVLERGRQEMEAGRATPFREQAEAVGRDDLATLVYTSGTTGSPKGVMLTHFNLASNVAATEEHEVFRFQPGDIALSFLPLSHVFERMVDYYYWSAGVGIAYVDQMDRIAESLAEVRPHVVAAAPRVFEKIYAKVMGATGVKRKLVMWAKGVGEAAVEDRLAGRSTGPRGFQEKLADKLVFSKLRARTGGRVRGFVSGSAPLSADIARFFWAAGLPIYEGYGLTESSPVLSANRPAAVKLGTVGQPIPGTEIRIDAGGEILARGPQVMKGYWNQPEATAESIDGEGWLHTGDVGEIDDRGMLRITDRIKNLIVTAGGKNIAPQPIENEVAMSPYISQVVMLGDKRAFPTLLVVPDFDNLAPWAREQGIDTADREAVAADPRVRQLLEREALSRVQGFARYEQPKKIAVIPREFTIDSGELTPTMKVRRGAVESNYRDAIEELYGE